MSNIVIHAYNPAWPAQFQQLHNHLWPHLCDIAIGIEHVGSTAVPGLAAKPVIDLDIVIPSPAALPAAIGRLAGLGYRHRGDLGIAGREAFRAPLPVTVPHHLYVCVAGSPPLENHLVLRDYLRANPLQAQEYEALKRRLAGQFPHDSNSYVDGKTSFIAGILTSAAK